jgi:hypothetical protein
LLVTFVKAKSDGSVGALTDYATHVIGFELARGIGTSRHVALMNANFVEHGALGIVVRVAEASCIGHILIRRGRANSVLIRGATG